MWYFILQILCALVGAFILFPVLVYALAKLIWAALTYDKDDLQ